VATLFRTPSAALKICPFTKSCDHWVGWSPTLYNAVLVASFACLIVGTLSALYGLSVSVRRTHAAR
jgi:hypothetical protein